MPYKSGMCPTEPIPISYNRDLKHLENLLKRVRRPGDFYAEGAIETPMPRLEVKNVGVVSFPLPENQATGLIKQAERAPYGRGDKTILDTSVRNVWQLSPDQFQIGGKSWDKTIGTIISQVKQGLGCADKDVTTELYKLLIYDPGSFFLPHRDSEKAEGMFATLVISLPSFHRGGELVIRHEGRYKHKHSKHEIILDLSTPEVSELRFAAFYADCEHEVRPTLEGYRVCLIYNLIQQPNKSGEAHKLTAPIHDVEIDAIARLLKDGQGNPDWPKKIVWLLEHEYSASGLSFSALKNSDAAVAKALVQAANQAGYAAHLAIVHISESGAANPYFDPNRYHRSRRYRYRDFEYDEADEEDDFTVGDDDFEVVEAISSEQYMDSWKDSTDQALQFGRIPLGENELIPEGALDHEKPDEQRLTEATGNAGVEYERAYHRAALVLWPQDKFAEVLFDAGYKAVVPFLKKQAEFPDLLHPKNKIKKLAKRVIDAWGKDNYPDWYEGTPKDIARQDMLQALQALDDASLLRDFIETVLTREFDGSENKILSKSAKALGPVIATEAFSTLIQKKMEPQPRACFDLFCHLASYAKVSSEWHESLQSIVKSLIQSIPRIGIQSKSDNEDELGWRHSRAKDLVKPEMVAKFFEALSLLKKHALCDRAAQAIAKNYEGFDPGDVVVPALGNLFRHYNQDARSNDAFSILWQGAAEFLLNRSEYPPEEPRDWHLSVKLSCKCDDCKELEKFAIDPKEQIHRFPIRQDRRAHLHQTIDSYDLDMDHVTERKGSPYTLVCTKNRRSYKRRCEQFEKDILALSKLVSFTPPIKLIAARIQKAVEHHKQRNKRGSSWKSIAKK